MIRRQSPVVSRQPSAGIGTPLLRSLLTTDDCRQMIIFLFLFLLGTASLFAAEADGRWALLISGSSGDEDLRKAYLTELRDLRSILEGPMGFPRTQIMVLFDDPSKDQSLIQHRSTRENVQAVCRDFAARAKREDLLFVFIEGHGQFNGQSYQLNLDGPDLTAGELASMLNLIPAQRQIIVNATNCSGGSLAALSHAGRIVITSTKSGMETNQTRFGQYFVGAFKNNAADSDKNGRVSMIEAFSYARGKIEEYYKDQANIQTEHPGLDDNGDGQAQANPAPENGEGLLARMTYLDGQAVLSNQANLTPEQQKLAREAVEVEMQLEALKYAKNEMSQAEYEKQLEALLLKLAQLNAKLPK
jgi:hypothetical protein